MEAPTIRIVLAERHQLFREAVVAALSSEPGFRVEAAVGDGLSAVTAAARHHPDMALLGATIRDYDPLTATAMIREDNPDCRVVLLGGETDDAALVQAVEAGVSAYLPKSSTLDEVVASIRAVHRGEVMIPLGMLGALLTELTGRRREREALHRLTATLTRRECEVLLLLAQGADNDTMAGQLFISPQTARTHVQNILSKMGVHSRLEAAALVNRCGLVGELERRSGQSSAPIGIDLRDESRPQEVATASAGGLGLRSE